MTTDLAFVPVNVQLTNKPSLLILLGLLKSLSVAKHFPPVQLFLCMGLCVMSLCVVCQYFNNLSDNCMIKPFTLSRPVFVVHSHKPLFFVERVICDSCYFT